MTSINTTDIGVTSNPGPNVNVTLLYMCSLFGFMKEWLKEGGVSMENAIVYDNDAMIQNEWVFSDADCKHYLFLTKSSGYGYCEDSPTKYKADPLFTLTAFTACMTTHFVRARGGCYLSQGANVKIPMTLLSKNRLLYTFMVDTLNAEDICPATNDTVTLSTGDCGWYLRLQYSSESACSYNTPRNDSDREFPHALCFDYHFMKSLGADSVCDHNMTSSNVIYMCSLFGFMKEWLKEGGVSMDNAMIYDNDTIVQNERMFSDADCDLYQWVTRYKGRGDCEDNSTEYKADPLSPLTGFTTCMTTHFMTKMGARDRCPDIFSFSYPYMHHGANVKIPMTLLSKNRLLYTFMVNTLNAEDICPAVNDTVTLSAGDCDWYLKLNYSAESACSYNTTRTDSDRESAHGLCLDYQFMKSLGADSTCESRAFPATLVYMCGLFRSMTELLQEEGISMDTAMMNSTDTILQKESMFSSTECDYYTVKGGPNHVPTCKYNSMLDTSSTLVTYLYPSTSVTKLSICMIIHFMTKMEARHSCFGDPVRSENNTDIKNTMTLLSRDRLFYTFMVDTLNARNICPAVNDTVTFSGDDCDRYIDYVYIYTDTTCARDTPRTDSIKDLPYDDCLQYRVLKSMGADSICQVSLIKSCVKYYYTVQSLIPTCICVIGLTGNLLSLYMFCSGAVTMPTAYQLQWLEVVDIIFILTWWIVKVLPSTYYYFNAFDSSYMHKIEPVLFVCLRPLSYVARSCTTWLTVLIGLYRYLAVCKPYGNLLPHCTRHGHKYVILVVILSFLYNIPHFCEYYLFYFKGYGTVDETYYHMRTHFLSDRFYDVYATYVHPAVVVCIPFLILSFVTVSILVKLKKRDKKKRNMQTSQVSQASITVMLVSILITFIICQLPYFVWFGFGAFDEDYKDYDYMDYGGFYKTKYDCSFMTIMRYLVDLGLLLNSSANGFIYFFLNKSFRDALSSRCHCGKNPGPEEIEMERVNARRNQDGANP